ncbi:MAG TPA: hypothetical protein VIS06_11110 [Mycobacteriales bacterium]
MNDSDTEIRELTFNSESAEFTDFSNYDAKTDSFPTRPATTPRPVEINLSLPAHTAQDLRFRTCSSSPSPGGSYEFGVVPAAEQAFIWATGYRGRTCLGLSC